MNLSTITKSKSSFPGKDPILYQ